MDGRKDKEGNLIISVGTANNKTLGFPFPEKLYKDHFSELTKALAVKDPIVFEDKEIEELINSL